MSRSIAIIGIGLRLPKADTLDQFWRHLAAGRSLISEVPEDRWDKAALHGNPASGNKTASIWGGFVEEADCFDAPFFSVSPREAAWMDPQQRFALEMAWHAIEDAGYRTSQIAGSRTGVYMGVCHWDYAELLEKHLAQTDAYMPTGIAFSIIANRVSHFFDLHGPSIANDTACAASLTAIYEAVRALDAGDCEMALAGGVNLIWSPNHFVAFSKAGMLSKEGSGKAFDDRADGYVRGEGGGVLLLKPLDRALADGDPIHAVIRGIGVNHGGRTSSLTVTSPDAQASLIESVHCAAGVTPDRVSYIEAHGPGTPLGDPIEIAGLKQAFAALHAAAGTQPVAESCGIGSVKTNIGHLEGAAGVAGIAKLLAGLRYGALPANVGFQTLNRLIDLSGSPFRIQAERRDWPSDPDRPRLAGISSFGFGGANAHALLEEAPVRTDAGGFDGPVILPISARDEDRLAAYAERLRDWLRDAPDDLSLADLAYTFQTAREPMEARAAVVASNRDGLIEALESFLAGEKVEDAPHADLAARWRAGEDVDWSALYTDGQTPRRIHAPLYPFARHRYWMDASLAGKDTEAFPHPLAQRNLSGLDGPRYRSLLGREAFYWADHHVGGQQILPGVACLEAARAALEQARGGAPLTGGLVFEQVSWTRPIRAETVPVAVETRLDPKQEGGFSFTISAADGAANAQGVLRAAPLEPLPALDLAALADALPESVDPAECYRRLVASGVTHGPAFQALRTVRRGPDGVLAELRLGRLLHGTLAQLPLHPVLLDAAIQAWIALDNDTPTGSAVPFACGRIEMHGPCTPVMHAHVRRVAGSVRSDAVVRLDIDLTEKDGKPCLVFRDLALRLVAPKGMEDAAPAVESAEAPTVHLAGRWVERPVQADPTPRETHIYLAGFAPDISAQLAARTGLPVEALPEAPDLAARATGWFRHLHGALAARMRAKPALPQRFLVLAGPKAPAWLATPLAGLLRTAAQENPKLSGEVVAVEGTADIDRLAALLAVEATAADGFAELRHDAVGNRFAWQLEEISPAGEAPVLNPEAAYWITGGLGRLGLILAGWLAARGARHLVLSGRRIAPDAAAEAALASLRAGGAEVHLEACDVTDAEAVARTVARIESDIGPLKGIIHAAGLLDDGYILTKAVDSIAPVLAPKIAGTLNIDRATRDSDLDFLLLCSSIAASFGNAGQGDYAGGNAFLDGFAEHRTRLAEAGERHGVTLSIGWPLWEEGGMSVDATGLAALARRFGTVPMPTAAGLGALDRAFAAAAPRQVVLHGARDRIDALLAEPAPVVQTAVPPVQEEQAADDGELAARTIAFLKEVLAERLQMDPAQLRADRRLEEYGLDSITIVEATAQLEEALGPLSKTLFFEYVDLAGIAAHLVEERRAALMAALPGASQPKAAPAAALAAEPPAKVSATPRPDDRKQDNRHDIAIVGLSLRVARAASQDEFWQMLSNGLDGFEAYPAERWNHAALLHPERDVLGKTVVKTGAFLKDIDRFDPRYFRISQHEAELMSPEVRLFLEASVEAFEDAGYSREYMQARYGGDVAVLVGSMTNEYDLYGFQNMLVRGALASGSYTGTVPNMVSYFYGFTGPSYFLDTMCSASSTCVHEAVHMLRAGRCKMALAGGVSLLLHPQKLIATSQEHFTSKTAEKIRGYGLGADGTILGEGVGALVLKPLADAERDGDHIYGVIIGSGISNAGVRNGFTVPNPHQQAAAIEQALEDAAIDAASISYVEGHGSGTALGDPIEVKALTQAFRKYTDAKGFCPLGTVKSNVAHLLAAAGVAGIAKVLAQLRHGQIAPSLHAEVLNPNIPFADTPFRVQRELAPWTRPRDAAGRELPRRAGVTSIGAGGMNSHILIEEHAASPRHDVPAGPELLVFSAMSEAALIRLLARMRDHVAAHPDLVLADLAYTLQTGRNELPCRLALVADDIASVPALLADFISSRGPDPRPAPHWHFVRSILEVEPPADAARLRQDIGARALDRVGAAWTAGASIDWDMLHEGRQPRRISLPAYPFERVRCWYPEFADAPSVVNPLGSASKLHPFIGVNRSGLEGLRYKTAIHPDELLDYSFMQGRTRSILPTVAAEIALALGRIAGLAGPLSLRDLAVCGAPAWADGSELHATLDPQDDGLRVRLEMTDAAGARTPYAEARVQAAPTALPTESLPSSGEALDGAAFTARLAERGYGFAPYLEVVTQALALPDGGLLLDLARDHPQQDFFKQTMQLPPRVLAALYQSVLLDQPPSETPPLLAGLASAVLGDRVEETVRLLVRRQGDGTYAVRLFDAEGAVLGALDGVRFAAPDALDRAAPAPVAVAANAADGLVGELRVLAAAILKFPAEELNPRELFYELGFDSISLTRFAGEISEAYKVTLSPAVFFECEHIEALAAHLASRHGVAAGATVPKPTAAPLKAAAQPAVATHRPPPDGAVAIIGLAGRFPGAATAEEFFARLLAGDDLTGELPLARYGADYRARLERAGFPKRGGFLADIDRFDAGFFRISPVEAERLDPQQRLMLETAWRALEDAGYRPEELPRDTGVFVGVTAQDYAALLRDHGVASDGYVATGNSLAMVANRLSHFFDLNGPSEAVDTACSSSLVALLRAADAVRSGRCGAALVGGVNLTLALEGFEGPHQAGMLSPEGRCKSFGAKADGYARGEGVVALLLKPLAAAERDGDRIFGLLIGGAENHGGRAGSLTAPNAKAQADLVVRAMRGIDPASIACIEAHGTGTALGDPVEANGLRLAYDTLTGGNSASLPPILLGSVKSNIGHLEAAAGLAGVVKMLLAMRQGRLPASLHCAVANPHLDLAGSPFRLAVETQDWPVRHDAQGHILPRRAGISSFGFGGSNAHVVLEAYEPVSESRRSPLPPHRFADTRYWIPGVQAETVTALVPHWVEAPLVPAGTAHARHIMVAGGIGIATLPGVDLLAPSLPVEIGAAYGALADMLLRTVQDVLKQPGKGRVLVQLAVPDAGEAALFAGLGAMLDSIAAEHPRLLGQTITLPAGIAPAEASRLLAAEATGPCDRHVRYRADQRCVRSWNDAILPAEGVSWQEGAVTLIAGGMGGLGRMLARDIAESAPGSVLVLTGRAALDAERQAFLEELRRLGAKAEYRQVDIADEAAVAALVREVAAAHGRLDRVVQAAGMLRDGYALRKSSEDLATVLAPKLKGTLALWRACRDLPVKPSFVLFSSLAGAVGNPGQADYAAANGFMDALAEQQGAPLLAIGWPLWRDGGMRVDVSVEAELFRRMGQRPLESADGLGVLRRALAAGLPRLAVIAGEGERIRSFFAGADRPDLPQAAPTTSSDTALRDRVAERLRNIFAEASGLPAGGIDPSRPLEEYGIDSLMVTRLNAALEAPFGALPKTLLFEHRTLAALAAHLAAAKGDECRRWTGLASAERTMPAAAQPVVRATSAPVSQDEPIAIIGLSGRYPGAPDLDAFWANLAAGRDAITEIPPERWDMEGFFQANADEAVANGRSYAKWGGFLEGFAEFDPFFFRISPRDAAAMDPQERLFLIGAWAAFEDAGYGPTRLARQHHGRVGVFAGVTKTGYALHGPFRTEGGAMVRPGTSFASVANRVSHALDLSGPSLPVDTMCSSSLTAIHEACAHLRAGSCEVALAGGVNLYLHPANFVELSAARMLSAEGRCKSFGYGGDGFVPGEGVGCVILKPLSRALADGDRIHALIRATAINHGGHANGYTVPSPAAQRDLIRATLEKAGLTADAVTCIEAHGTGTALGDPIELDGLTQAFRKDTAASGFCALGSVKSNIGHLEAAAGIAGLTKILLQMRHGQLAPTLHASVPNPNLALADSPFRLQQELSPWQGRPRIAGLSSFGAGGANAHAIIEEWPTPSFPVAEAPSRVVSAVPLPVLLSARDPERLREMAEKLLAFVETEHPKAAGDTLPVWRARLAELLAVAEAEIDPDEPLDSYGIELAQLLALKGWAEDRFGQALVAARFTPAATLRQLAGPAEAAGSGAVPALALADISHTLQIGREALECRLAIEAASLAELAGALRAWLDGRQNHPGLQEGNAKADRAALAGLLDATEARELAARWLAEGRLGKALALWAKGQEIDWPGVPGGRIVSLPTYPFARQRFWIPRPARDVTEAVAVALADSPAGRATLEAGNDLLERQIAPVLRAVLTDLPEEDVVPELRRWRQAALALLASTPAGEAADWEGFAAAHREDKALAARIALAGATLRALPDTLAGRVKPTAVMFPDGGMGLVEGVYKDNPVAARFSDGLAGAASAFVAARLSAAPDRRLRILEIGAGTGGTSVCVFRALAPHRAGIAEYLYTDVSRAFLIHAERSYADSAPHLTTALFDVEKPLAGQGVTPHGYDLVIAANVLHATADMRRTLATVRETLAPGGLLLANETSAATLFTHVTFGLLEGWWRFTDPDVRIPGTPSLTPASWRALLEETGLHWVGGSPDGELALGQQLIAARLPEDAAVAAPAAPVVAAPKAPEKPVMAQPSGSLRDVLLRLLAETLNVTPASIDVTQSFADYGLDSILGMELVHRLRRALDIEFDQTRLFDFASVAQLEGFIAAEYPAAVASLGAAPKPAAPAVAAPAVRRSEPKEKSREPIAIIGASGRFAKSPDMEALWGHLLAGRDLVEPVSRFDLDSLYRDAAPGTYGRHGSFIEGIDQFDPVFFGISGLEATYMDPQQRLFLEEAWNTLENAGHAGADIAGRRVGVFVGCSAGDYHDLFKGEEAPGQAFWGNTISLIPARIAYLLDLKGPAVAVDTACSSSLVALHLACQSLWNGEAEMALAGGVFVHATARFYRSANQAKMLSPSGRCAAFGAGADGIVPGEAVGAVLLRPLAEALADGDTIQGVIVASGTNQDGATNGITAPSAASQERLIRSVYDGFGIDPDSIGLVEAHGTGTVLGDPIEHAALTRAFRHYTERTGFCALGSVKSNIGHATTAAGIAGLAKLLLALRHRTIPPTIHVGSGNPAIRMDDSPFFASENPVDWKASAGAPRRAAISSFGFSGTNAHAVVEEAPALPPRAALPKGGLIVLSARTPDGLRRQAENLLAHLDKHPEQELADIGFTLLAGRRHLHHRLALVASDRADLAARLRFWLDGATESGVETAELDEKDRRADPARQAEGEALIAAISTAADPMVLLPALARHYLAGDELDYGATCPAGARRVPLPTYPFERKRYWVKSAEQPKPAVVAAKTVAQPIIALPEPAAIQQPVASSVAPPKIRLAPLTAAAPVVVSAAPASDLRRLPDADGVRRLELSGGWSDAQQAKLAGELAAASTDESVRAVLVTGDWDGTAFPSDGLTAALDCAVPVVAALAGSAKGAGMLAALQADFLLLAADGSYAGQPGFAPASTLMDQRLGREAAHLMLAEGRALSGAELRARGVGLQVLPAGEIALTAAALAVQIAQAPRLSLVELKRHMRHALPPRSDLPSGDHPLLAAIGEGATAPAGNPRRIALASPVVELEIWPDGVALLRLCERQHKNTFTPAFMDGIQEAFTAVATLPEAKVVVLTGHDGYFACGGTRDGLTELQSGATRFTDLKIYSLPLECELPVIAAMQGHGIGAGWSLGMYCDLALFGAESVYHSNYLWFGFTPGAGATLIFPERLGDDLGREVLFTAREYKGRELAARRPGLTALSAAEVLPRALSMAHALAARPRGWLVEAKSALAKPLASRLSDVLAREVAMHETTFIGNARVAERIAEAFPQAPAAEAPEPAKPAAADGAARLALARGEIAATLAEELMIEASDIRDSSGFLDLGLDSILAVTWLRRLNGLFGIDLPATSVYAHPTVGDLAAHVARLLPEDAPAAEPEPPAQPEPAPAPAVVAPVVAEPVVATPAILPTPAPRPSRETRGAVAITGASGRFPKAADLEAFWENIRSGRDCIEEVPADRWDIARHYHPDPQHPDTSYCKWMGAIDGIDRFDAGFFTMTPREAELTDPQQRLFLQHAWHAIEDAALDPLKLGGAACGVFVGAGPSGYADLIAERNAYSLLGSSGSILAARIAHLLDLRGPSLSIDTACSSSLVAIAEACNSLLLGDCDLALAGGACVLIGPSMFIDTAKVGMLSKDGRCFTFDARANGFVPGEGVGVLLLKRLEDALADGDPVRAVIRGWGTNQDGRTNGITAPNPQAQTRLMQSVHHKFGIDPASIGLIECHGTGTALGDPIEIEGLCDAFAGSGLSEGATVIGSVKANVGHLLASAGVAGAMKAMLALERAELPPAVNFQTLNPHIRLAGAPFRVNPSLKPWPAGTGPRRVAVSSFGFSGTNAHLVLEEAPPAVSGSGAPGPYLFVLSARDHERLSEYAAVIERFVAANPALDLGDLAHTLRVARSAFATRLAFTFRDRTELLRALSSVAAGQPAEGVYFDQRDADGNADAGTLDGLARLWAAGRDVDFAGLQKGRRIRLPGYPFARDRHWVVAAKPAAPALAPAGHPLLEEVIVTPEGLHVGLTLRAEESWLTHHATGETRLSLGLFLPELARAALARQTGASVAGLRHLVWGRPVAVNGHPRRLSLAIRQDAAGLFYQVMADGEEMAPCHLGEALPPEAEAFRAPSLDPASMQAGEDTLPSFREFAARCAAHSGPPAPEAASVQALHRDGDMLTARLTRAAGGSGGMVIDPLCLDAVWRVLAFAENGESGALPFPYALESLTLEPAAQAGLPEALWLRLSRRSADAGWVLSLHDAGGQTLMTLNGVLTAPHEALAEIRFEEEAL
ncbi:SDR family NAD(P)-dependent oxidoreductase [Oceanibaculum indicum]|uniref:Acyl transferase domain-containing protein n=1 Tax=Oceanibaculum indicum TaxID=526216 RepID=A0A420WGF2_9PROT|nr:SDR family NAD(P)-dependent oxidoreductase [Oceanibaculum indicum]RKQ70071.1 acyl transferase domain-containing protein [Oceanibaculum indicum]